MAVVLGNLALLLDVTSPRTILPDRKTRPVALDALLNLNLSLPKREPHNHAYNGFIAAKGFDSDGEARSQRVVARGKANSKVNGVDFGRDEEGNGNGFGEGEGDEEPPLDWEKEMRRRVKEIEERKELEKKAEELQSKIEDDYEDDGREETEQEKRMRVRKELEKVSLYLYRLVYRKINRIFEFFYCFAARK